MLFIVSSFDKEAAIAFRTKAEAIKLSLEQAPEALNKQCNIKPGITGKGVQLFGILGGCPFFADTRIGGRTNLRQSNIFESRCGICIAHCIKTVPCLSHRCCQRRGPRLSFIWSMVHFFLMLSHGLSSFGFLG